MRQIYAIVIIRVNFVILYYIIVGFPEHNARIRIRANVTP